MSDIPKMSLRKRKPFDEAKLKVEEEGKSHPVKKAKKVKVPTEKPKTTKNSDKMKKKEKVSKTSDKKAKKLAKIKSKRKSEIRADIKEENNIYCYDSQK